jgi:RimJ/RimL family protein N-acetyltransferase
VNYSKILVGGADRLLLQKPRRKDMRFIGSSVRREDIMQSQGGVLSREQVKSFLQFVDSHWETHGFGHFLIWRGRRIIGLISLKLLYTKGSRKYDLGFGVLPAHRNQGIATRAGKALLDIAFGQIRLKRVTAMTLVGNRAGERVLAKLHFSKTDKTTLNYMGKVFRDVTLWELTAKTHVRQSAAIGRLDILRHRPQDPVKASLKASL